MCSAPQLRFPLYCLATGIGSHSGVGVPPSPSGGDKARNSRCWARGTKRASPGFASFIAPDFGGNLVTLGQICHATLEMNDYYPLIARAVERLDRSTGETRRAVYERAAQPSRNCSPTSPRSWTRISPRSASPLKRRSARWRPKRPATSPTETRAEPRSAAPSEGMPDGDKIQTRDHLQPASPDRDDRPPALPKTDKRQYSCPPRPMTITTQISRPSQLAELTAPIIITMMSRARAGGAVSSS